jgi:hypothetical protein
VLDAGGELVDRDCLMTIREATLTEQGVEGDLFAVSGDTGDENSCWRGIGCKV